MSIFEQASRLRLRFESAKGDLTVEDLWSQPLSAPNGRINLDDIARALDDKLRHDVDRSFVQKDRKSDEITQLKFDIVKHIIDVRLAENEAAAQERSAAARRQKILAIIADREDEELRKLPIEELRKAV